MIWFNNTLKIKLSVSDTSEITDETVYDVYNKCGDLIACDSEKYENKICQDLQELVKTASDLLFFGDDVMKGVDDFKIKKVIYSSDLKGEWKTKLLDEKKYNYELIEIKNINNINILPCNLIGILYYTD